ncbi:MAG: hypothetical protein KDD70_17790, partial [Bdellovibrionales bacterium]|nr:hypothetical protein [Bdellovibrionales bacterium]
SELCNRSEEPTGVMRNSGESGNSAGGETSLAGGTVGSSREFGDDDEAEFSGEGPGGSQPSTQNGNWIP